MRQITITTFLIGLACLYALPLGAASGKGKHIVLVVGDQEYRSEESMPALARILSERHGFKCTVLLPANRQTGEIDPQTIDNIPGLEALRKADLMVLFARWLELPDEQMKEIGDYTNSGRPVVGVRTSSHPCNYRKNLGSPYAKYSYNSKEFSGGYGRQVLGETWKPGTVSSIPVFVGGKSGIEDTVPGLLFRTATLPCRGQYQKLDWQSNGIPTTR